MTAQHHSTMRLGHSRYFAGVTTKPSLANLGLRRLVLTSTYTTNVSTLLKWARTGYEVAYKDRAKLGDYLQVFAEGFNLGTVLAEGLMRGDIPVEIVDDDTIHVMLNEHQATLFASRMRGVTPLGEATLLSAA